MINDIYYADICNKTHTIKGFYCTTIHGSDIPAEAIPISFELWQYLLELGDTVVDIEGLSNVPLPLSNGGYSIKDKEYFTKYEREFEPVPPSEVDQLKEEVAELKLMLTSVISTLEERQS